MGRSSTMKGKNLGHREFKRMRLICDFLTHAQMSSEELQRKYYGDLSPESFHKTFKRDRDSLAKEGIYLVEHKLGPAKTWSLDKQASLAAAATLSQTERRSCALLLQAAQTNPKTTMQNDLGAAIARIGQFSLTAQGQLSAAPTTCDKEILATLSEALQTRTPVLVSYQSLTDTKPLSRTLYCYGMFSLGDTVYLVALRKLEGKEDALRTLNVGRMTKAVPLNNEPNYEIPADFSIADYRLLPFELGDEAPQTLKLHIESSELEHFKACARQRGTFVCAKDGSATWTCSMRNTGVAVSWTIASGAFPLEPREIVDEWIRLEKEAFND